ncbi:MAG: carbon-nitrogen hydrolase family protein [Solirubrobacterales bacterium]|nr:carbon-nitrogen hydrolase family protein [Solirubrobacterales bacterium]
MRAAAVQLNASADTDRNLELAERLVRDAAADGAALVVLPEKWTALGDAEALEAAAQPLDGPAISAARSWASELGVTLVAGSFTERREGHDRLSNTSVLIDPEGEVAAIYRKLHMFDVDVGGVSYRESDSEEPGEEIEVGEAAGIPIGLSVCYDLRFPELYRIMAVRGAKLLTVPAAFTAPTGKAHWEPLLRARAIENQAFVVGANQVGKAAPHYDSRGHSMIVDAWGEVLAETTGGEGFVAAELDFEALEKIRADLPSLANRRPAAYRWPELTPLAVVS